MACRPHSEQAVQLPGDSLTGTEPLPRHRLQPQGIMSKRTWGTGLKCHWSHSPQASSCWREMRGWLWLERHAISQTAYLRPSFSTHPSCLMAAVAWHFAQEGGTGPALHSVSIQREPCCPGMERNHIQESLGLRAFHTSIAHSIPHETAAVSVSRWQTGLQGTCENRGSDIDSQSSPLHHLTAPGSGIQRCSEA